MLVLSRKIGQKILIGSDIEITIVRFHHGKVRVGVTCPLYIKVLRAELADDRHVFKSPEPAKE